jgi:hypothetical protein
MGNSGRDDDEGESEAEDDVGKAVDARRQVATKAKALVCLGLMGELHGCGQCSALAGSGVGERFEVFGWADGAEMTNFATEEEAVDGTPDTDEEEEPAGVRRLLGREEVGDEGAEETDDGVAKFVPYVFDGDGYLEGTELEVATLAPGIPVESGEAKVNGREAEGVDLHHLALLIGVGKDVGIDLDAAGHRKHELDGIDVEEDGEEEGRVDPHGAGVVEAVAAEEAEVGHPDEDEKEEADGKGEEAEEGGVELVVGAGNFEGDDEEGEGEAEDDVGEAVDAGHVGAAETEAVFGDVVVGGWHLGDSVAARCQRWGGFRWSGWRGRGG